MYLSQGNLDYKSMKRGKCCSLSQWWTWWFPVCWYSASLLYVRSRVDISWLLFQFNYSVSSLLHPLQLGPTESGGNNRLNPPSPRLAVGNVWPAPTNPSNRLHPRLKLLSLITEVPRCGKDQEVEFSACKIKLKVLSLTSNTHPLQSAHLKPQRLKPHHHGTGLHYHVV